MNLSAVLVTGLFAGGVSCAAVQGGLLAGLVSRQRAAELVPPIKGEQPGKNTPAPPSRSVITRLGDDLAPVGSFLVGKLVSHTLVGAALGALGGVVELSVQARMMAQIGAGLLIVIFGLAQLGVPGFRSISIEPPIAWSRLVRGRARSTSAFAPTVLGLATVLVPCGITLSVEALALTSGSAWSGAAIMAVFVCGTSPMFALLGYVARKAATAWRGRLAVLTGLVVLGMGLYTLNGGLELAGSPLAASRVVAAAGFSSPTSANVPPPSIIDGRQTVVIEAHTAFYGPSDTKIKAGIPTTLTVSSHNVDGCVRSFVIPSQDKQWILPTNGDTHINLGALQPGQLRFTCGMGMYSGQLSIVKE